MINIIKLTEHGISERSSRVDGIRIKNEILLYKKNIKPDEKIIIDFDGIEYLSTGFAKELIGTLYRDELTFFKNHISLKVNGNNKIKNIIIIALNSI